MLSNGHSRDLGLSMGARLRKTRLRMAFSSASWRKGPSTISCTAVTTAYRLLLHVQHHAAAKHTGSRKFDGPEGAGMHARTRPVHSRL